MRMCTVACNPLQVVPTPCGIRSNGVIRGRRATTPEQGPVSLWSPKFSTFSSSDSSVGEGTHQVDGKV